MRVSSIVAFTLLVLFAANPVAHAEDPFGGDPEARDPVSSTTGAEEQAEGARDRVWVGADSAATERVLAALDSTLSSAGLDFVEAPLEEIVAFLSDEYGIEILLDARALDDLGIGTDLPITVSFSSVKLSAALRLMLQPHELDYHVTDGVLVITSRDTALTRLETAIYSVADLIRDEGDYHLLIDTITATVDPGAWAARGRGEAEIRPYPRRGVLVISQTTETHELVRSLLEGLGEHTPREVASRGGRGGMGGRGMGGEFGMARGGMGEGMGMGRGFGGRANGRRANAATE